MTLRACPACAKPLKSKTVIRKGVLATVWVCKSPICRRYGKEA